MTVYIVAILFPLAALAIIFAWVPLLNLICPPCTNSFAQRYFQEQFSKERSSTDPTQD
jgi:hypothetical protein